MSDDLFDKIISIVAPAILGVILVLMPVAVALDIRARNAFMEDCMKDRKQYECTALWRAGQSSPTVMPVVIPVR